MTNLLTAKCGDIIILKDKQTLEDQYEKTRVMTDGLQATIDRVQKFEYRTDLGYANWMVYRFKDEPLVLVSTECKFNDGVATVTNRLYFQPDAFTAGTRQEVLENSEWLFDEPPEANWTFNDLDYAYEIFMDGSVCHKQQTFIGQYGEQVFLLTEWETTAEVSNPHLLSIEVGDYVEFFQGCDIRDNEIDVFRK